VPDLVVEFCLLVARGVISLSFSPFLAGVDGTFKGSAAEDMGISGDERTWGYCQHVPSKSLACENNSSKHPRSHALNHLETSRRHR